MTISVDFTYDLRHPFNGHETVRIVGDVFRELSHLGAEYTAELGWKVSAIGRERFHTKEGTWDYREVECDIPLWLLTEEQVEEIGAAMCDDASEAYRRGPEP